MLLEWSPWLALLFVALAAELERNAARWLLRRSRSIPTAPPLVSRAAILRSLSRARLPTAAFAPRSQKEAAKTR